MRSRHFSNGTSHVRAVPIPDGGLAARTSFGVNHADAYAVVLPPGAVARDFARAVFESRRPRWVFALTRLRNVLVAPLGLKTPSTSARAAAMAPGSPEHLGPFPVIAEAPDEVLLGVDDRHLDFRISLRVVDDAGAHLGVLSTFVRFHGALGRSYFAVVGPFHRRIVPAMLRRAAQLLAPSGDSMRSSRRLAT